MAAPVMNTPAPLEHRINTPYDQTLAVAERGDQDGLLVMGQQARRGRLTTKVAAARVKGQFGGRFGRQRRAGLPPRSTLAA